MDLVPSAKPSHVAGPAICTVTKNKRLRAATSKGLERARWACALALAPVLGVRRGERTHGLVARAARSTSLSEVLHALQPLLPETVKTEAEALHQAKAAVRAGSIEPQGIISTVCALAKIGYRDNGLLATLADLAVRRIPEFQAPALTNLVWAYAKLNF